MVWASTPVILVSAPPAPSAPPPHKWGGCRPLRRLRRHLPINGEDKYFSHIWCRPLRRLRRHLPINGEDKYFSHIGVGPSGAFAATSPWMGMTRTSVIPPLPSP